MDLRVQAALFASLLSLALAGSVLLRSRKRRLHWTFGIFGLAFSAWYSSSFGLHLFGGTVWARVNFACSVVLPIAAMQFFLAFAAHDTPRMTLLSRTGVLSAALLLVFAGTPLFDHKIVLTATFLHGLIFMSASLWLLRGRARAATSRFERARLRYLILVGALAGSFTLLEYLPLVGLDIPPVGTVLVLLFLYVLSQSIVRYRLLDLYELAARLGVLTTLAFALAAVFWLLLNFAGERFFLHAFVAAMVVLVVFDPLRMKVADVISQFFFRERYDLESAIAELRRRIAHVFELDRLVPLVLDGLERSGRITDASVYLLDSDHRAYSLAGHVGRMPPRRLELAPSRPLLERLRLDGAIVADNLSRDLDERRELGEDRDAETLYEILQTMDALFSSATMPISSAQGDIYGLICVGDERMRDAFSPEEVQVLLGLATQTAIAVENSQLYQTMRERDRLAALGEMAAGLAHEIRNPLGAIKASAQYLGDTDAESEDGQEFLDIIVEEVDRLNRVVESFLTYARPVQGNPTLTRVEPTVERTVQLLAHEAATVRVQVRTRFETSLAGAEPPQVRIDAERLRQVLINLVQNAFQAMPEGGQLTIDVERRERNDLHGVRRRWVEIRVTDTGHGVPREVHQSLFLPFVTTRDRGTGLGLALSQRIVTDAGGQIAVRSTPGRGSTFIIRLPEADSGDALPQGVSPGSEEEGPTPSDGRSTPPSDAFETLPPPAAELQPPSLASSPFRGRDANAPQEHAVEPEVLPTEARLR